MLAENLPEKIGFTEEEQETYYKYKEMFGVGADKIAKEYMCGKITQKEAIEKVHHEKPGDMHENTADLVFLFECSGYLLEKYKENGLTEELFVNSMCDITYKLHECINVKGVFGTFVVWWFDGFFRMTRFAFGRLQYDVLSIEKDEEYDGYIFKRGDLCLSCHIPSAGPLAQQLCEDSFLQAYRFFKDRLRNGILPIKCSSWLLYPPYLHVFGEESNTGRFIKSFRINKFEKREIFGDAWRIFGMDFEGDTGKLPAETTMQRNFINYIRNGGDFGTAEGILLFDGENILTARN